MHLYAFVRYGNYADSFTDDCWSTLSRVEYLISTGIDLASTDKILWHLASKLAKISTPDILSSFAFCFRFEGLNSTLNYNVVTNDWAAIVSYQ